MPRKVFTAGEILTAADVNTNLMDQAVMVFADDTARTSAIPTPSEGMVTYRSDDDVVEVFDGSVFAPVGVEPAILQVVSTTKTDTFTTTSGTFADITGLSLSITPTATSSKVLLIVNLFGDNSTAGQAGFVQLVRDSTAVGVGDTAGDRTRATTALSSYAGGNTIYASGANFLDSPNTTSATTYKVQVRVTGGTGFVNRSFSDTDNSATIRAVSSITAMEVAG